MVPSGEEKGVRSHRLEFKNQRSTIAIQTIIVYICIDTHDVDH